MILATNLIYLIAAMCFVYGLKMMGHPSTARRGNFISAMGMLIAVIITCIGNQIIDFRWIGIGLAIGALIGVYLAFYTQMTEMPQMVALLNGFGGLASFFVAWDAYHSAPDAGVYLAVTILLSILIGGLTFSGSMIAWAKLKEVMTGKPILFKGQQVFNTLILVAVGVVSVLFSRDAAQGAQWLYVLMGLSLILGITSVIPIGGADMPVVIALLNSYSGLAACSTGFVINNNALIVTGSLVGASGLILTNIMCKAMNRSLANVLFSGFGSGVQQVGAKVEGEIKPINVEDAFYILEAAKKVVVVPGYGMAVSQAQHVVKELGDLLEENGCDISYAIHPVAGRMPGHMNVLLAEASVSYDQLVEMDSINPIMETVDVAIVIGANDVVNPAAREDKSSPIYGMPIINVDYARTVFVLKRSMAAGFAGIDNPLFFKPNTRMLFGDAKGSIQGLVAEFKEAKK